MVERVTRRKSVPTAEGLSDFLDREDSLDARVTGREMTNLGVVFELVDGKTFAFGVGVAVLTLGLTDLGAGLPRVDIGDCGLNFCSFPGAGVFFLSPSRGMLSYALGEGSQEGLHAAKNVELKKNQTQRAPKSGWTKDPVGIREKVAIGIWRLEHERKKIPIFVK